MRCNHVCKMIPLEGDDSKQESLGAWGFEGVEGGGEGLGGGKELIEDRRISETCI